MAKYTTLNALFTAIANSIRSKTGGTEKIVADDFPSMIDSLSTGGVNAQGLNARIFTSTVSSDAESGEATIAPANDYIASIRSNPKAFVLVRYLDVKASTAMLTFWFGSNFTIVYGGGATIAYNMILGRQSTTYQTSTFNTEGLTGVNYSGHLCVDTNGRVYCYPSTDFPLRAGTYQIIAGTLEML